MEGPPRCIRLKQILAILGIISGVSIFFSFGSFKNVNAALWGLLSAIFAAVVFHLHTCYRRRVLHIRYTPESLRIVKSCGILLSIASLTASIVYFVLMAVNHQGYQTKGNGYAPAGVFALLTLKWTVMMYFAGRKYERFLVASVSEASSFANDKNASVASPYGEPPPPYEATMP